MILSKEKLKKFKNYKKRKRNSSDFSYNSNTNRTLSVRDIQRLIKKNYINFVKWLVTEDNLLIKKT